MKLTEYIIDNLLGAIVGNALGTALVLFYAPEIRAIIYLLSTIPLTLVSGGYIVLLYLCDLFFIGERTMICYRRDVLGLYLTNFYPKKYFIRCTFVNERNTVHLIVPSILVTRMTDLSQLPQTHAEIPPINKKLKITYFRHSKILLSWELVKTKKTTEEKHKDRYKVSSRV